MVDSSMHCPKVERVILPCFDEVVCLERGLKSYSCNSSSGGNSNESQDSCDQGPQESSGAQEQSCQVFSQEPFIGGALPFFGQDYWLTICNLALNKIILWGESWVEKEEFETGK